MKPLTSTSIKPLLSATLFVFLFEGCMHSPLAMNTDEMDVEEYPTSSDGPRGCLPAVFRNFVELIEGERAESDIATFLNKHSQSLNTVYTWEEEQEEDNRQYESSCLHLAAELGRLDVVEQLLKIGVPVDMKTQIGRQTPLMFAAKGGSLEVVKYLIGKEADVNAEDSEKSSVAHYAAGNEEDDSNILAFVIASGAQADVQDQFGLTILSVAAGDNLVNITEYIVKQDWGKKLVDTPDINLNTPLHVAACRGYEEVAEVLLEAGAKDIPNARRKCPSDLAARYCPTIKNLILAYPSAHAVSAP